MAELLWVTNLPAPYRVPLWKELPVDVICMAVNEPNRAWALPTDPELRIRDIGAPHVELPGQRVIYFPSSTLHRAVTGRSTRPSRIIVDGWESPAYLYVLLLAKVLRIPVYLGYRATEGRESHWLVRLVRSLAFRLATGVLAGSPATSRVVEGFGVPQRNISIVDNVVDVRALRSRVRFLRREVERREGHTFLFVGQLIPRKNVATVLRAFAEVAQAGDRLLIVGEGPEEPNLRSEAQVLGVDSSCDFWGGLPPDRVAEAYALSDTLLLPSTMEIWGLVAAEALACGLHVVVSAAAGCADVIGQMQGVFVAQPSVPAFVEGMQQARREFGGHIDKPAILDFTPARAARQIAAAVGLADASVDGQQVGP